MTGEIAEDRVVLRLSGADCVKFMQGLVSNDLGKLDQGLVYCAMLSPQGKYLFDFFQLADDDTLLLDVKADCAAALASRLSMYRLRADVVIAETDLNVSRGLGPIPKGGFADPRHATLGWRFYGTEPAAIPTINWTALRVAACVPETGVELLAGESYILECGFERLNGVDFKKGCYVGQEVTARMKHKTELRKGLARVRVEGTVPIGTPITIDGKKLGVFYSQAAGQGIAYLRFDRATGEMQAGSARLWLDPL